MVKNTTRQFALTPAVVVGTGTMGLAVIRALGEKGVPVVAVHYDPHDHGYLSRYVIERIKAPHPEQEESGFLTVLQTAAEKYQGAVLFPVSDTSLVAVSRHKRMLELDFRVACTDWEITEQFIEKKRTYALAETAGVPAPKTIIPTCIEQVAEYASSIQYPCLVKPSTGHLYNAHFGRKMVLARNRKELCDAYQQAAAAGFEVMLQEFIPGEDSQGVNYNAYVWEGRTLMEFTAQKVRSAPPRTGSPCVVVSSKVPEVTESGRRILKELGFYGYACTEFKLDPRDGVYKLMEVNGRHNLSGLLAVRCGLNFPWVHYRHLTQGELPQSSDYRTGVFWIDINRDLYHGVKILTKRPWAFPRFLKPYFKPHVNAILDLKDPRPFFKRGLDLISRPFKRKKRATSEGEAEKV